MAKQDHPPDEVFMKRAFELARFGSGYVSPNPLVGCVIVHDGKVVGEGWHKKYGEAHAEVNAVASVGDKSILKNSTVFVNLEPCSHFGKTPPCADMLIREQVKRVVISNLDSNPLVSGQGIAKLRVAGIRTDTGTLEQEGRELNKRFFTYVEKERPYIILKWAETSDGFIAQADMNSKWISNPFSRKLVHKWRTEEDAVLVGMRTALHDNPKLNVRDWSGRNPIRIVIDRNLKLTSALNLFDGTQKTICYNLHKDDEQKNTLFVRLEGSSFLSALIEDLHRRKIQSVIIEGGAQILQAFINAGLWDEARIFTSLKRFNDGVKSPVIRGNLFASHAVHNDVLRIIKPELQNEKKT
jgi:diaminohydroxyphosphoribosylaminopyrimidine deaminase / 5-amino-6-(5-phosphoribosylamino)uracil reductase